MPKENINWIKEEDCVVDDNDEFVMKIRQLQENEAGN